MKGSRLSITLVGLVIAALLARLLWRELQSARSPRGATVVSDIFEAEPRATELSQSESPGTPMEASDGRTPVDVDSRRTDDADDKGVVDSAIKDLSSQVDASLDGFLYINDVMDQMIALASLPIETQVDFDYEDNDCVAYRVLGTPSGVDAHFLVGIAPFDRDGKAYRYLQFEVQMDAGSSEYYGDAVREGPRVHLTIDYDEAGEPGQFALITERRVDLFGSRQAGIDAYQGRYTSGAGYKADVANGRTLMTETFGIINGQYAYGAQFQGVSPLAGDIELDPERIRSLFRLLDRDYKQVRRN